MEHVSIPTLLLWGMRDQFLKIGLASMSLTYCEDGRLQTFEAATHRLQREEPTAVNAALLSFLSAGPIT